MRFVKISRTKSGKTIKDKQVARQLTAFLHAQAGLGFHYQLFSSAADINPHPLLEYEYSQLVRESTDALVAIIRNKLTGQLRAVKFVRKNYARSVSDEMRLHAIASASECVVSLYHRGSSSTRVYFVITKLYGAGTLRSRMSSDGMHDDKLFWRLASQIARGVADIHRAGILHLALQPDNIELTETGGVRIGEFHRACEARQATSHQPSWHSADEPAYRSPEDARTSFSFASDVHSVGLILFEMATGSLPKLRCIDLSTIEDDAKRELIAFTLYEDPSARPTAKSCRTR